MSFPDLLQFYFSRLFCFPAGAFYQSAFGILNGKPTEKCRVKSGNSQQCVLTGRTWINADWFSNNLLTSIWSSLWNIYFPRQGFIDVDRSQCRSKIQVLNILALHHNSFWILAKKKGVYNSFSLFIWACQIRDIFWQPWCFTSHIMNIPDEVTWISWMLIHLLYCESSQHESTKFIFHSFFFLSRTQLLEKYRKMVAIGKKTPQLNNYNEYSQQFVWII